MKKMHVFSALIIAALIVLQMPAQGADKNQKLFLEKSFSTELGERLKINGIAGDVKINSWCKNVVVVRIYGTHGAEKFFNFSVRNDDFGIHVSATKKPGIETARNFNLKYEICVPRNYSVKVSNKGNKRHRIMPISEKSEM